MVARYNTKAILRRIYILKERLLHTPEGVRDIYGKEYLNKSRIKETLLNKFHLYGYDDIQTPTFEFFDVFSSNIGTIPSKDLFKFFDKEGNTLVLRPDFTPSIARCVAKYHMGETMPIRLCYTGNTFINVSDLQGRLKESTQIGVELINDSSLAADAETIALMVESLKCVGLKDFQITIGNVEFFKGLCEELGIDNETEMDLRDYISNKNYFGAEAILDSKGISGESKEKLLKVTELFGQIDTLFLAKKLVNNERSLNAIDRLLNIFELLKSQNMDGYISFDMGMLSKYNYYTGVIFRAYTYGVGDAIMKGGRYDKLLAEFGDDAPAIGFAIVLDDLYMALERLSITNTKIDKKILLLYDISDRKKAYDEANKYRSDGKKTVLMEYEAVNEKYYEEYAEKFNFTIKRI